MANNATVSIWGRVTKDPVVRTTTKGEVLSFPVVVNTSTRKADGTYESNFYDVSVWGKMVEYLTKELTKGMMVAVVGDFCAQSYEAADKTTRYSLRINANRVNFENKKLGQGTVQTKSEDDEMPF